MSNSRVDQQTTNESAFSSRRSSLVVNLSSKRHQRSSVTTTTTRRRAFAHSLGSSFASGPFERPSSPLDSLRERLAAAGTRRDSCAEAARQVLSPRAYFDTPGSAPATLVHSNRRLVVDEDSDADSGHLETTATIRLASPSRGSDDDNDDAETPTRDATNKPTRNRSCNLLQVVELDEDPGESCEPADGATPIVELRQSSSSESSSSSARSSPVSSRQSSDCERRTSGAGKPQPHQSGPDRSRSSSPFSSSESSRKLIRRRTVRRSYHHRALEESEHEQQHSRSSGQPVVVTTTTTRIRRVAPPSDVSPTRSQSAEPELEAADSPAARANHLSPAQGPAARVQTAASRLSTSRSSSKIATITTSSSSTTNHHLKKSTTSRHTVNKSLSRPQDSMAPTGDSCPASGAKLDLSSHLPERAQQSMFDPRIRSPGAAACLALEREEASSSSSLSKQSSIRKSSELSTSSSTSFNASSSLTKSTKMHQRQVAAGLGAGDSASGAAATAAVSSSTSSSCETSLSRSATKTVSSTETGAGHQICQRQQQHHQQADLSSHFRASSASLFLSSAAVAAAAEAANRQKRSFLSSPDNLLLSSPDVRSLVQELGSDFAELESAMTASSSVTLREQLSTRTGNELTSRLFGALPAPAQALDYRASPAGSGPDSLETLMRETNSTIRSLEDNPPGDSRDAHHQPALTDARRDSAAGCNGVRIRELIDKAQRHRLDSGNGDTLDNSSTASSCAADGRRLARADSDLAGGRPPLNENEAVQGKIERIAGRRMNDLCRKLESCNDPQKATELLKIMIQTIEKAWSIPVCGDDLGFKLCSSLRQFGGLDMILGFIHEADARLLLLQKDDAQQQQRADQLTPARTPAAVGKSRASRPAKQLKLNLSQIQSESPVCQRLLDLARPELGRDRADAEQAHARPARDDEDSDILTSDLGLDSTTSVESLSYASARTAPSSSQAANNPGPALQTPPASDDSNMGSSQCGAASERRNKTPPSPTEAGAEPAQDEEELRRAREEELVLLSAHLLSQCLTSENRDYIVKFGLDPVIKLACQFTTMKSQHSKQLLRRSALARQSSTMKRRQLRRLAGTSMDALEPAAGDGQPATAGDAADQPPAAGKQELAVPCEPAGDHLDRTDDLHSAIGTEILQHLFKHSEETCSRMITLGALQAVLYGCRSSHVETLRHCASALANLALYGGPDSQQTMVEQKAHVWLFPLAFNEDDNVQYYACLAIVVLAANQEIEADVLQSSTLDLVEPFVTSHEPRRFAESTTSHIHGQSAAWLKKLMPLLESKREEARNLACFHFAMEAHIKREQGQTQLFKEIGSVEPLRRAGSSPIAIASKFACQALRFIGEREPHKLSQQVPLWTCEDVCEWVGQVGFEQFRGAFRESHVDGDLLLQLDEEMLKFDIGIANGIIRRRFLRELGHLKRLADYSSVDRSNLGQLLISSTSLMSPKCSHHHHQLQLAEGAPACCAPPTSGGAQAKSAREYLQYIYPIIQLGVTRDNIHLVDCDQLLAECNITNALHRAKLASSIRELQDRVLLEAASSERNSLGGADQKTLDVFVSYRRSTGSQLASLLKVHLQLRGFSVFIDVERLEAGKFDNNLLESIRTAKNFILVLSPSALDRCIGDHECKDWVHKEIVAALASNCNIIPIIDNFHWPDPEQLPEDMRSVSYFNGIRWIHDYQDACVDKVERFIRGELSNSGLATAAAGCPSTISMSSAGGGGGGGGGPSGGGAASRIGYTSSQTGNVSTPSIISSTLSLCGPSGAGAHHALTYGAGQPTPISSGIPTSKSGHDHPGVGQDSAGHPLGACANPYLNYSALNSGNVNPNIRLR